MVLQKTSKKVFFGEARYQYDAPFGLSDPIYYIVFDANELQLRTRVVSEAGKTLEDAVIANQERVAKGSHLCF